MPASRTRSGLALAAAAAVLLAGSATAAPKKKPAPKPKPVAPVCNLINDEKGDAKFEGQVTAHPSFDIITGDLATDGKNVTGVLRMDGNPAGGNPEAIGSSRYYLKFSVPGAEKEQYLGAIVPFTGAASFRTGQVTPNSDGTITYTNDTEPVTGSIKANIITISAPLAAFSARAVIKPGQKLGLSAETFSLVGVLLVGADDAAGKAYIAGNPSCVKPGVV
ncbi:MAG TPA: hypothetical protein VNA30_05645 [Mycobacteriales bacterium]|nr:hypothetical protein [Mycobacteriales bacterium]